jgi:hypothetical protein
MGQRPVSFGHLGGTDGAETGVALCCVWGTVWGTDRELIDLGREMSDDIRVTPRVRSRGGGPVIFARWRDEDGAQVEPSLGRGWLVKDGDADVKSRGKSISGGSTSAVDPPTAC